MSNPKGYAITVVCLTVLSGCAQRRAAEARTQEDVPWQSTRHWIHDEKLRAIMATLGERQALDSDDAQRDRRAKETAVDLSNAARYATAMSQAADGIRSAVEKRKMIAADRAAFDAQVETLRDQAEALAQAARAADIDAMHRIVEQIDQTCNACHTRFRDYSGLLEPSRRADKTLIAPTSGSAAAARYAVGRPERLP